MANYKWNGNTFLNQTVTVMGRNLDAAARYYRNQLRIAVSVANQPRRRTKSGGYIGLGPSSPGEPPRKLSGQLRRTLASEVSPDRKAARVGTNLVYAKFLELGTRNMAPRPFLTPTLEKNLDAIGRIAAVNEKVGG